ncbi:ECF transporter S component [Clostridium faecium]|uniref:Riboflavin transporter n=1 Tax=Clostridium faecium TaxID=2762223 RepID=A0ABR8YW12_9CLOT|nr:ECF transporter S component [Clostridium faecium]MBD8048327.1 ECF transporter S component [Clostridium faecium]MDU1349666.1 ECF transporter S component [Clostridium argentinense]
MRRNLTLDKMIKLSLLSAIAFILMYFDFPILPAFPWLKMDLSDVPALMGAFAFGPLAGAIIEAFKNLLILLLKGTSTGFIGEMANFLIGVSLVCPAAYIYHKNKTLKTAILSMFVGLISMEIVGIIANVFFLIPIYMPTMPKDELIKYVMYGILPFNGIKSVIVSAVTFILYKRVSVSIFKVEPMAKTLNKKAS